MNRFLKPFETSTTYTKYCGLEVSITTKRKTVIHAHMYLIIIFRF